MSALAKRGRPEHEPSLADREMVEAMVAGGMIQVDIAGALGVALMTLRKHYREELDNGRARVDAIAMSEHVKCMKRGEHPAIKWHHRAFMGISGQAREDAPANQSMRVVVEFVGEAAPAGLTIEHAPRRDDDDGRDALRRNMQLIG